MWRRKINNLQEVNKRRRKKESKKSECWLWMYKVEKIFLLNHESKDSSATWFLFRGTNDIPVFFFENNKKVASRANWLKYVSLALVLMFRYLFQKICNWSQKYLKIKSKVQKHEQNFSKFPLLLCQETTTFLFWVQEQINHKIIWVFTLFSFLSPKALHSMLSYGDDDLFPKYQCLFLSNTDGKFISGIFLLLLLCS